MKSHRIPRVAAVVGTVAAAVLVAVAPAQAQTSAVTATAAGVDCRGAGGGSAPPFMNAWTFKKASNIRSGPGTNYRVTGSGGHGQLFCSDQERNGWVHGQNKINGDTGWVAKSLLNISD